MLKIPLPSKCFSKSHWHSTHTSLGLGGGNFWECGGFERWMGFKRERVDLATLFFRNKWCGGVDCFYAGLCAWNFMHSKVSDHILTTIPLQNSRVIFLLKLTQNCCDTLRASLYFDIKTADRNIILCSRTGWWHRYPFRSMLMTRELPICSSLKQGDVMQLEPRTVNVNSAKICSKTGWFFVSTPAEVAKVSISLWNRVIMHFDHSCPGKLHDQSSKTDWFLYFDRRCG